MRRRAREVPTGCVDVSCVAGPGAEEEEGALAANASRVAS